ncbi:SseB family protein [Streptomyces aidingensis]|uniref:SseB protein N-terminal domain-containing protein n=1 Tax=Streptomyces aidingensis TaxID=910347 RepID=A0A1I1S5I5_9ACTN|nr:SseB family protein [Streptomyces aidingensis]SFD39063.1 SseB protein N-terminal domain-containing protein [Streptomyces aidingensis]
MNIPRPAFADDDGSADPEVSRALAEWAREPATEPRLLAALARSRLLVPVVAVLGEAETGPDGRRREKHSDMALLTLQDPGGRRALPVFTSAGALARWRADARPVAVTAGQALAAAVQEKAEALVVDLAGPVAYQLTGPALRAFASGGAPARSPEVAEALRALLAAEPAVRTAHLVPGGEADGTLAVVLGPDGGPADGGPEDRGPAAAVRRLAAALAADPVLRARLARGLRLAVLPSGTPLPGAPLYRRVP